MTLWIDGLIVKLQMNRRSVGQRHGIKHDELSERMAKMMVGCRLHIVGITRVVSVVMRWWLRLCMIIKVLVIVLHVVNLLLYIL